MRHAKSIPWLLPLLFVAFLAQSASAALLKYEIIEFNIAQFEQISPNVSFATPPPVRPPPHLALIDESGPSPVLKKLLYSGDATQTNFVPQLSGFLWFGLNFKQGPNGDFTGTGSTASSISWGQTTGWTITGPTFCNAQPSFVCNFAVGTYLQTIESDLRSTFYDLGTWVFHGTGFTADGFVFFTSTFPGNSQVFMKGPFDPDGTVPALPLLGMGALGASLFAMGLAALRRRRG